ncbi:unnamed protein product [Pleuronectes platessa]|uniref:Uncharacterized protein n=1 Tax=Pleuronectes platessa TaxID=8262 RepID=A0A9N7Z7J0_PLEPL|nr:unnamed protein product [Pleuronectes platessa]
MLIIITNTLLPPAFISKLSRLWSETDSTAERKREYRAGGEEGEEEEEEEVGHGKTRKTLLVFFSHGGATLEAHWVPLRRRALSVSRPPWDRGLSIRSTVMERQEAGPNWGEGKSGVREVVVAGCCGRDRVDTSAGKMMKSKNQAMRSEVDGNGRDKRRTSRQNDDDEASDWTDGVSIQFVLINANSPLTDQRGKQERDPCQQRRILENPRHRSAVMNTCGHILTLFQRAGCHIQARLQTKE